MLFCVFFIITKQEVFAVLSDQSSVHTITVAVIIVCMIYTYPLGLPADKRR